MVLGMNRPTISLTCIAKNERHNIDRLSLSTDGCFDKRILVDTGSTDGTIERAKELGWQVEHFDWIDDFSAARNYALSFVDTDYWMWLDLDDSLQDATSFKHWRDYVMNIADIWFAPYHYSIDQNQNPTCVFLRERVLKTSQNFKFTYAIHEGVISGSAQAQMTKSWFVRHHRTIEDLKKDKGRNIRVFDKMIKNGVYLDPRMTYYYGKELFEANRVAEAQEYLVKSSSDPNIDIHDRLLSIQYLSMSLMRMNQWDKALMMAYSGLELEPKRAEFYNIAADCLIKMNRVQDAIPLLHAAQGCPVGGVGAIFQDKGSYYSAPRNTLARIYANSHQFEEAERILSETMIKSPNDESMALLQEIQKLKQNGVTSFKDAKPCDDIVITCPNPGAYKWDSKIYKERHMGGSETAEIELSKWFARLSGRRVIVFNEREDTYIDEDKVEYRSNKEIVDYMRENKPYLHIAWRHNYKVTDAFTVLHCHDLYTPGAENHDVYNLHACLTPFHRQWAISNQGIPENKIWLTRNGIVPERFGDKPEKDPNKFVFSSSPDRGLDRAILVLDEVRKEFPEIKLHVFYGISHLDNYGLKDLRVKLETMMNDRKDWIVYHGGVDQKTLAKEFASAAYCVQPSPFIETSCITALERYHCGIYQIMRSIGGVVDTLRQAVDVGGAKLINDDCLTQEGIELYAKETIQAIRESRYKSIKGDPLQDSWELVARQWLDELPKFFCKNEQ